MQPDAFAETLAEGRTATESKAKLAAGSGKSLVGRVLNGQYRVESQLGQGAMGVVFRGTQLALGKPVAIKMLRPDGFHGEDALDRFSREATLVSKLVHPSIAQVLDFGVEDGMPFLVMEFVEGEELTAVLKLEGPMPPRRAIAIIRQLASALEEAHKHGVVHRDIKPHNLRLMRYTPGGQIFLKVLDFGIAKQLNDGPEHGKLTATGAVMGTPAYMAPEQAGGQQIDARADQYAIGIVLYELLTGSVPFTGETITGVLVSHLTQPPPPLPRDIPEPLRKVVMRLLEKNPHDRFSDVTALDQALAGCEAVCRDVPPLSAGEVQPFVAGSGRLRVDKSGQPVALGIAAVLLAFLMLGGVLWWGKKRRPGHEKATSPPSALLAAAPKPVHEAVDAPRAAALLAAALPATVSAAAAPPLAPLPQKPETVASPKPIAAAAAGKFAAAGKNGGAAATVEPPEVKAQLDEASQLIAQEDYARAIDLARRTNFTTPTSRAYRLLVTAYCKMGSLEAAKTAFRRTSPQDRRALIALCHKHDIELP